jgi:RNA polymerase sigma factor (sigma-70 family)
LAKSRNEVGETKIASLTKPLELGAIIGGVHYSRAFFQADQGGICYNTAMVDRESVPHPNYDQLVSSARQGDTQALNTLLEHIYRFGVGSSIQYMHQGIDPEEVGQQAMIKAWGGLSSYATGTSFESWARTIIRNVRIDMVRSLKSHPAIPLDLANSQQLTGPSAEQVVMRSQLFHEINELLGTFRPNARRAVKMRIDESSYEEIHRQTGLGPYAVKANLQRVRKQLQEREAD